MLFLHAAVAEPQEMKLSLSYFAILSADGFLSLWYGFELLVRIPVATGGVASFIRDVHLVGQISEKYGRPKI